MPGFLLQETDNYRDQFAAAAFLEHSWVPRNAATESTRLIKEHGLDNMIHDVGVLPGTL